MRLVNYEVATLGPLLSPSSPIQEPPRSMSTLKTKFLQDFLNNMEKLEVIGPGYQGDSLSLIHLVQRLDKQHRPIEGGYRCTWYDEVEFGFQKMPCAIPSAPETVASIESYKFKVVVDLKDGFFHIGCSPELQQWFGVISRLGVSIEKINSRFINSPGIMQSMMLLKSDFPALKKILEEKWDATVPSFLDDGTNDSCPYDLLAFILQFCIEANLTITPANIQIGKEVIHLGKLLTNRCEIAIAQTHMEIISSLPFPTTPDLARRALAFLNYFWEFVPSFAPTTSNLWCMAHAKPFNMHEAQRQFQNIKATLINSLPLRPVPTNACLHLFAH